MDTKTLLLLMAFSQMGSASTVHASNKIVKQTDEHGRVTYTNRAEQGQKRTLASLSNELQAKPSANKQDNPFRAKNLTHSTRIHLKQQILEEELAAEKKLFSDTRETLSHIREKQKLAENHERIVQLKNKMYLHQRNIVALRKELDR